MVTHEERSTRRFELTVLYDNMSRDDKLTPAWGLAYLLRGPGKTILFDTGGDGEILLSNMKQLGVDADSVDVVAISHEHWDHTGGLDAFLGLNSDVDVYCPVAFSDEFKSGVRQHGARVVEVRRPVEITEGVHSTGQIGTAIKEQAIALDTLAGLAVLTGCAHPGVVELMAAACNAVNPEVHAVMGGFHLLAHSDAAIQEIMDEFKRAGVQKAGPSHCTGEKPIAMFKEAWGDDFLDASCGAVFVFGEEEQQ